MTKDEDLNVFGQILLLGATREAEDSTHNEIEQGEQHGWSPLPNLRKGDATRALPEIRLDVSVPFRSQHDGSSVSDPYTHRGVDPAASGDRESPPSLSIRGRRLDRRDLLGG
jgi:hypothetical protein